ncbi:hypothetical protein RB595_006248 [Gaeumannomyces hyphopodioides]
MRISTAALLAVFPQWLAGVHAGCSQAGSVLDAILARGRLRVGTTGSYKPFSYKVATGGNNSSAGYIGADIDMARALSSAMGLAGEPEFVPASFANLTADVRAGLYDVGMTGVSITTGRALSAFFTQPVLRVGKAATVRCGEAGRYQTLADIDRAGVRVATPSGGSNEAFDRANLRAATIVVYSEADNNIIFQAVADGKADVMITDVVEAELQARLHPGVLCAVNPGRPFSFEELGYILPRDVTWLQFVNQWLHIQQGSGAWNKTLEGWMSYPWPTT